MSRIGKKPIIIPAGVDIQISNENAVTVKGTGGVLLIDVNRDMRMKIIGEGTKKSLIISRPSDEKRLKALHGLYHARIQNMVSGVTKLHEKSLEVVGVGYKAEVKGNLLELSLGFSHGILFEIPSDVSIKAVTEKRKNPVITIAGRDKQLVGQIAAKIRSIRKPEPYKGKGIRYSNEVIIKKAGKAVVKAATA